MIRSVFGAWTRLCTPTPWAYAGYIGGLWSLGDEGAARFATSFYNRIRERLEAGEEARLTEVLRATRREFLENGDPTFLAYVFYGNPELVLIRP